MIRNWTLSLNQINIRLSKLHAKEAMVLTLVNISNFQTSLKYSTLSTSNFCEIQINSSNDEKDEFNARVSDYEKILVESREKVCSIVCYSVSSAYKFVSQHVASIDVFVVAEIYTFVHCRNQVENVLFSLKASKHFQISLGLWKEGFLPVRLHDCLSNTCML